MAQSAEQEPTMEEILASIRRIINEDDEGVEAPEAAAAEPETEDAFDPDDFGDVPQEAAAEEDEDDGDVLELTEKVEEDGLGTDPMAIADDLMILDREDEDAEAEAEVESAPEPEPEPVAEAFEPEPAPSMDEDRLVADTTASAAAGAFAALSGSLKVATDNNQTLEGIVRELMKPMLKQWLDDNLPSIVEEKVQAEIERIARSRR
ncbi:DUF2497 domain-containing protein [Glycocaulis profundi]|nr:DUF2497 domain-containing protein [Glycocaulis profundi]